MRELRTALIAAVLAGAGPELQHEVGLLDGGDEIARLRQMLRDH